MVGADAGSAMRADDPQFARLLDVTLSLLGKRWSNEKPVIVKANVPVNFIADAILQRMPHAPTIVLYFPLVHYLAAILRTSGHENWTSTVVADLRLMQSPYAIADLPQSVEEQAALLWFAQMKCFERLLSVQDNVRSLDARALFAEPSAVIAAAAGLMKVPMTAAEIEEIVSGELFRSYSKNPSLDYDLEVREARERQTLQRIGERITRAIDWAKRARDRHGLADELAAPLIGPGVPLLG